LKVPFAPGIIGPVNQKPDQPVRLDWLDRLKGIALVWIFVNHVVEQFYGGASFGNPGPGWPPLRRRLAELAAVPGSWLTSPILTVVRDAGWLGDQAVGLFLLASGFGLAWALLRRAEPPRWRDFYGRRLFRIYPLWWGAHLFVVARWMAGAHWGRTDVLRLLQSLIGLRIDGASMYLYAPAWWFIGLLIQLYLVFPLLWMAMARFGPGAVLAATAILAAASRGLGLGYLEAYMDPFIRGSVLITRLPELVLGMTAAWTMNQNPAALDRLRTAKGWLTSGAIWLLGTALSFTWAGLTVAPLLTTAGAFGLFYPWLVRRNAPSALGWIGIHSYALFLVHHPLVQSLLRPPLSARSGVRIVLVAVATVAAALALEWGVGKVEKTLLAWYRRAGLRRMLLQAAAVGVSCAVLLVIAEKISRRLDPTEVDGWGEKRSLEPDPTFDWKLKPSKRTRLRWKSYDYTVVANELGFPGPLPPAPRSPGSVRILVTGDAFSSAEGVDTALAWPRLLEDRLRAQFPGKTVEVVNFSITGYGPNQYAAVVAHYVPLFRPDLVLVESYANDFDDALRSGEEFQQSIGFSARDPDTLMSALHLSNLRNLLMDGLVHPLKARLKKEPNPEGLGYSGIPYLERNGAEDGVEALRRRFAEIRETCQTGKARLLVAMVPVEAQVCRPDQLAYWPDFVNLQDSDRFDLDRPQKLLKTVMDGLGVSTLDLRAALRASPVSPCQPRNLHWTEAGHRAVAEELARTLVADRWLEPLAPPKPRGEGVTSLSGDTARRE
jgi:peptidoglycan/LPS O-acetylase OafA/YrhL